MDLITTNFLDSKICTKSTEKVPLCFIYEIDTSVSANILAWSMYALAN